MNELEFETEFEMEGELEGEYESEQFFSRLAQLAGDGLLAGQTIEPLVENGELVGLRVDGREIRAQRIVLSAGAGNAARAGAE